MPRYQRPTRTRDGNDFGRLTVLEIAGINSHGGSLWRCHCTCGNDVVVSREHLVTGDAKSCGCFYRDTRGQQRGHTTHGMYKTPTYWSWVGMRQRCTYPGNVKWADYGGRGITVCERWLNSFAEFLADMGVRPPGMTLDRFPNNDGNYEPGNCRWATRSEQRKNQREVANASA
jgi:hypothetical protein